MDSTEWFPETTEPTSNYVIKIMLKKHLNFKLNLSHREKDFIRNRANQGRKLALWRDVCQLSVHHLILLPQF